MMARFSRKFVLLVPMLVVPVLMACGGGDDDKKPPAPVGEVPPLAEVPERDPERIAPQPAQVVDTPDLGWTAAAGMDGVAVVPNRDSAIVFVPEVPGAADYRVIPVRDGVRVAAQGDGEQVSGADVFCAGYRQFNAPAPAQAVVMRQIEVMGLNGATDVVVEAIGSPCPFTGIMGREHWETRVNKTEVPLGDRVPFGVFTEAEIRARYGSVIVNGHGAGPALAAPAPASAPRVLARTTIRIVPTGNGAPLLSYFDDFSEAEQPVLVGSLRPFSDRNSNGKHYQSSRWNYYSYNYEHTEFAVDRGQLQSILADRFQEVFGSNVIAPRRAVQLDDERYLRVSFEVAGNATQRRYWWLFLCGPESGAAMDERGAINGNIVQTPFFYQDDGDNPSVEGWSCLQVFPRDGWPRNLPPDNNRPQSDVRVMVNQANQPRRDNVVNVSPAQYGGAAGTTPGWYRQQNGSGELVRPILDDQMLVAPRARYDFYIRRDRVIMFVNGDQRLCNDFPNHRLTMGEGAIGIGQVLYHSSAERIEFSRDFNDRTGQRYYLTNTPYADVRSWDNVGYQERVKAPSFFEESLCYTHRP